MGRKILKAAVIGAGKMGSYHASIYKKLKNVKLCALSTKTEASAKLKRKQFDVPVYTSIEELLINEKPDLVTISTPTNFHKKHISICLKRGCHVLLEKPISSSVKEAEEIIKVEKKSKKKIMVGHIERYNPVVKKARKILEKNKLGKIIIYNAIRSGKIPPHPSSDVLLDLGIHDFDLFNYLINERLSNFKSEGYKKLSKRYLDFFNITGKFQHNHIFNYHTDWIRKVSQRQINIVGVKAELILDLIKRDLVVIFEKDNIEKNINIDKNINQLEEEIKDFINCILKDKKPPITTNNALKALKLYEFCINANKKFTY